VRRTSALVGWRLVCVWIASWPFLALGPQAETWHVTYDPAQPEDRVGEVVAAAASGDLILIDPGTYYEHIPLEGKSLTFVGIEGAGTTILDGSRSLPGREGSLFYTLTGEGAALALQGLTMRNGTGALLPGDGPGRTRGGAVLWRKTSGSQGGSLNVIGCMFEDNSTGGPYNTYAIGGGAVYAEGLAEVRFEQCGFSGNVSLNLGSDLFLSADQSANVVGCDFAVGEDPYGAAGSIKTQYMDALTVQGCLFHSDAPGEPTIQSIVVDAQHAELLDNRFFDQGGPRATQVLFDCLCVGAVHADIHIAGNVFWVASQSDSGGISTLLVELPGESVTVTGNTLVGCGVEVQDWAGEGAPMVFENNIVVRGTTYFMLPQGGDYACNDFWKTRVQDLIGNLSYSNNTRVDPRFCDDVGGDFRLSEGTPCAPPAFPGVECGLIGAEPVACDLVLRACCIGQGCEVLTEQECNALQGRWMSEPPYTSCDPTPCVVPVVEISWGAVKALFRDPTQEGR
jgi:hypothetical protein